MNRLIIRPPGRLNMPRPWEVWAAREVFYRFGVRDLVLRYRQTAVGVGWVILQPLVSAGVFSIVFGSVARLPSGGTPYFVFSFAGMLAWNVFNGIVGRASSSLVANQALISKVFFPRLLVPLSTAISVVVDFVVGLGLFILLMLVFSIQPSWRLLAVPAWLLLTVMLASGIGAAASAVTVKYRDVTYVLPWILQILLYATPIAYSVDVIPTRLRWLFDINPLTWLMNIVHWSILGQSAPDPWQFLAFPLASILIFVGGIAIFQRFERGFADYI